ncbi:MAG: hemolysin III family protein [Paracoccaceae bacterium]|nr:MAG: hemolysin III family protein [Paracoccaceae bacterium]
MTQPPAPRSAHARAEYMSDAAVHVAGLALVAGAVPVLIVLTAMLRGDAPALLGAAVYGATLALMILCSALYNMIPRPDWAWLLQRLDHSAIYLKIAGTYTTFALISGQGATVLAGVWAAALAGVALKLVSPRRFRWTAIGLYLAMGWVGVVAGGDLMAALPPAAVTLMVAGGLIYTAGVAFYLWDRLPFHNTVWHVFVLAATAVFYAAVLVTVVSDATPAGGAAGMVRGAVQPL